MVEHWNQMNDRKGPADTKSPQVIAISAGKGGVGKTLLSVNLARTLSWSGKRVLLVDMDLYNRGSTTLVADAPIVGKITVADIMEMARDRRVTRLRKSVTDKELANATDDSGNSIPLYLVPSTATNTIVDWAQYSYDILELRDFLRRVIREFANKYDLDCVVFDCRPGPEPMFLAAAGIATDIILVTEADIVTLNGNINLYSYLANVYKENSDVLRNVRFVINRIPKGEDIAIIEQRYMKRLFDLFKTRPILASIPFDNAVFQSFGQHRFVVDQLPNSAFSKHVAAIAMALYSGNHDDLLSDQCRHMASTLNEPWFTTGKKALVEAFGSLMKTRTVR